MNKKRIGFVTGTRAEYGLLKPLLELVKNDKDLELVLFVTGMHLSPEFGDTYLTIELDGFAISEKIEILLSADTPSAISKSMGLGLIGFADAFLRTRPDLLCILGDRFEALSAATAAMVARIPIAHIHGGELTEGAIDDPMRHSITKMSQFHFVSTEEYKRRVIQLGEQPECVFTVGALGIDQILDAKYATLEEVRQKLPLLDAFDRSLLVTLHPETIRSGKTQENAGNLLKALDQFRDVAIIFTGANADSEGRAINESFTNYCHGAANCSFSQSLGSYYYLGLMRETSAVVGNSSSGILEAPAMGVSSVDIGERQHGRVFPETVIHCGNGVQEIVEAIKKAFESTTSDQSAISRNPYWHGGACKQIYHQIKNLKVTSVSKKFYDIHFDFPQTNDHADLTSLIKD